MGRDRAAVFCPFTDDCASRRTISTRLLTLQSLCSRVQCVCPSRPCGERDTYKKVPDRPARHPGRGVRAVVGGLLSGLAILVTINAAKQAGEESVVATFVRAQLVAAMGLGAANEESRDALWRAFDSGSWVSPQLVAVAFLVDENFEDRSRQRIEAGCRINCELLEGLDWLARHSAAGRGSFASHSSKALSALADLCQRLPATYAWLQQF